MFPRTRAAPDRSMSNPPDERFFHHFLFTRPSILDDDRLIVRSRLQKAVLLDGEFSYTLSLLGSDLNVYAICVSTEQHDNGNISPKQQNHIPYLNNYALSALRITNSLNYDMYNDGDESLLAACLLGSKPYPTELPLTIFRENRRKFVDYESILNIVGHTSSFIPQLALLGDSVIPASPTSYKFLSLYKIFEMDFSSQGKWRAEFFEFCSKYEMSFRALNLGNQNYPTFFTRRVHAALTSGREERRYLAPSAFLPPTITTLQ